MNWFINVKDFIYYNRKYICILLVVIISFLIFTLIKEKDHSEDYISENSMETIFINEENQTDIELYYVVDIKGEVINPGTYKVANNERVIDVITLAGGLTDNAETTYINLSKKVVDEMVIIIPKKGETSNIIINNDVSYSETEVNENSNKVSINNGTIEELMSVSGIGTVKAQAIINYRKENGKFNSIEEIKNVSGIGNSTFEKIKEYIEL